VYSLAQTGTERRTTLSDKLAELGLPYDNNPNPNGIYEDNPNNPSFLFLLGFILGDGSIFIRIRLTAKGSLNYIPRLVFPQKTHAHNDHFFTKIAAFFTERGVNSILANESQGVTVLTVQGVKALSLLVPLFEANLAYGYWKTPNINLLLKFFKCYYAGAHVYRIGQIAILKMIYQFVNKRERTLEE
jgi:hypothetical protein